MLIIKLCSDRNILLAAGRALTSDNSPDLPLGSFAASKATTLICSAHQVVKGSYQSLGKRKYSLHCKLIKKNSSLFTEKLDKLSEQGSLTLTPNPNPKPVP